MNKSIVRLLLVLLAAFQFNVFAQERLTPFDQIPGVIASYKPALEENFPQWAKMLYEQNPNFREIEKEYEAWKINHGKEKSAIHRYYKMWRNAVQPYVSSDGTIQLPEQIVLNQLNNSPNTRNTSQLNEPWSFLGPKNTYWLNENGSSTPPLSCPWQVNVYSFDVSKSNPNILFAGTETGFMNKSTDNGETWQLLDLDYYFGGGITAVAIDPSNSEIVFASAGNQIHKTTDGGQTWSPMLSSNPFHADRLVIDPQNPQKIIAAASNGVQISNDGGNTWQRNWITETYDVEMQPGNSFRIFALTRSGNNFAVAYSTDGGQTFSLDTDFPAEMTQSSGGLLATTPQNPDLLLAVLLSSNNTPYLLSFDMNSVTWSLLASGNTSQLPMNNGQGYFDLILEISPTNENIIFAGTTTLFKSTNSGGQFHAIGGYTGNFSIHPDIQDMKILDNGNTWVATDGGMSFSTDYFSSTANYFSRNELLVGSDMWGFDQGWNEDIVVGGRYHNGNTAIADFYNGKALRMGGAESPTGWMIQGKPRHAAFNDLGNGWILPSTAEGEPEGRFIFSKYPNMDEYGGRRGNMVFHPNYYGTIFLGEGDAVWQSTDMGVTWQMLHDFNGRVMQIQISQTNPNIMYADVATKGFNRSMDGGLTWELKPTLTSGEYGTNYWKGKTHFVISPTNENHIYACLSNGTWSSDIGEVFKSEDGGDTWTDFTGSVSAYTKNLVIQPDENGNDILYLFTNAGPNHEASVFVRDAEMTDWESFSSGYPAGFSANMALPFYRDSEIRVAGNAGVWEAPLMAENFQPVINPWVEKSFYNCMFDTLWFDDHSIINHEGVTWSWQITPSPVYINNPNIRNPKVVLGNPGDYSVRMTVNKNGEEYSKEITNMVSTTTCPSIYDCNNPAEVPKETWSLIYVDSEEVNYPGYATMSFDGDPETIWHTRWSTGNDTYPHEIQIDMGEKYLVSEFTVLNRQDGENGRIKDYELYISDNLENWGLPVSVGTWENTAAPQTIELAQPKEGQHFRLIALSEVNGNDWASAAEFSVVGCIDVTGMKPVDSFTMPTAYPIPTTGNLYIPLPNGEHFRYEIISDMGRPVETGNLNSTNGRAEIDLTNQPAGHYLVKLISETENIYLYHIIKI